MPKSKKNGSKQNDRAATPQNTEITTKTKVASANDEESTQNSSSSGEAKKRGRPPKGAAESTVGKSSPNPTEKEQKLKDAQQSAKNKAPTQRSPPSAEVTKTCNRQSSPKERIGLPDSQSSPKVIEKEEKPKHYPKITLMTINMGTKQEESTERNMSPEQHGGTNEREQVSKPGDRDLNGKNVQSEGDTGSSAKPDKRVPSVSERKDAIKKAIEITKKPDIICVQEIPAPTHDKWDLDEKDYGYSARKGSCVGVMWIKEKFTEISTISDDFKSKVAGKISTEVTDRMHAVLLGHEKKKYKILVVSWHGPYRDLSEDKRIPFYNDLQKCVDNILRKLKLFGIGVDTTLIGGDFNLEFDIKITQTNTEHDFTYEWYQKTERRGKLIDNFLYFKEGAELSEIYAVDVRPGKGKNPTLKKKGNIRYIESDEIKEKMNVLDHDPVLADFAVFQRKHDDTTEE